MGSRNSSTLDFQNLIPTHGGCQWLVVSGQNLQCQNLGPRRGARDTFCPRRTRMEAEQGVSMSELCHGWVEEALAAHFR